MKKITSIFTILTLVLSLCSPAFGSIAGYKEINKSKSNKTEAKYADGEIIVKFRDGVTKEKMVQTNNEKKSKIKRENKKLGFYTLSVPEGKTVEEMVREYQKDPSVESAEPNYVVKALVIPSDPNFNYQWGLNNTGQTGGKPDADIDAPEAWNITTGSSEVIIAVLDTGISLRHPELKNKLWVNSGEIRDNGIDDDNNGYIDDYRGWDFYYRENFVEDYHGHGTYCATIAAGIANNGTVGAGVAWNSKVMPVQVLDEMGSGYYETIANGIVYAADNGAKVISMSLGGSYPHEMVKAAVQYAYNTGAVLVSAAGNGYGSPVNYPGAYDQYCLTVGATDHNDELADFSSTGPEVDVTAPGVDIYSGYRLVDEWEEIHYDTSAVMSGTSAATPFVSGLAALIRAQHPEMTNAQVVDQIKYTTEDVNSAKYKGEDIYMGTGRINAYNALTTPPHTVINYKGNTITDNGNNDGKVDPGETGNMSVNLSSDWADASGVTASLTTTDSYVTITNATADFGYIAAGGKAQNIQPFTFSVSPTCPKGRKLTFTLNVTASGFTASYPFNVTAGKPEILFVDDDGGIHDYDLAYKEALDAKGITYDVWEVPFDSSGPTADDLAGYKVVIWNPLMVSAPIGMGVSAVGRSLTAQDSIALSSYLQGGGNLLITSSNLLDSSTPAETYSLLQNYLHVTGVGEQQAAFVTSVPGGIFGQLNLENNNSYACQMTPDSTAKSIFTINDAASMANGVSCGVQYPSSGSAGYRSTFLGFDVHQIKSRDARNFIINQAVDWLRGVTPAAPRNIAPTADPGANLLYIDDDNNGVERVNLDATASFDPDGTIASYEWKEGATVLSRSATFTGRFNIGVHQVVLLVTDKNGVKHSDRQVVHVMPGIPANTGANIPAAPTGPTKCVVNSVYNYSAVTTDPEGQDVFYQFDWGDGTKTTTDLYPSGTKVTIPHTFKTDGTFHVRVRAWDSTGDAFSVSECWSEPLTVSTDASKPGTITDLRGTPYRFYPSAEIIWTPPADGTGNVHHYRIYRSTTETIDKTTDLIKETTETWVSYIDMDLPGAGTYYYAVCAVDSSGNEADLSNIAAVTIPALNPVFTESFENGEWNGLWNEDTQNSWFASIQRATEGTKSAEIQGPAVDATLTSNPIDLQGKTNSVISFDWMIESGLDTGEYLCFDYSTDNGLTWNEVGRLYGNVDAENVWHHYKNDFNIYQLNGARQLLFRFRGTMNGATEQASVDNVRVETW